MNCQSAANSHSRNFRRIVPVGRALEKTLLAYMAAGAGLGAVAVPAQAQIVYTPCNTRMTLSIDGSYGNTPLDLNNDGIVDFSFVVFSYGIGGRSSQFLGIGRKVNGNGVVGVKLEGQNNITAAVLSPGTEVGSTDSFVDGADLVHIFEGTQGGYGSGGWLPVEAGFVGLKLLINGEVHYGWALVKFPYPYGFRSGSIYGYAYENTPNKSIIAGKRTGDDRASVGAPVESTKASLGLLATGARGLPYWRNAQNSNDPSR
jgi:hypothetical protein